MKNKINFSIFLAFLFFAATYFSCKKPCENKVLAVFEKARGVEEGIKVKSNGIEIGTVTKIDLAANGKLVVELCIDPKYKIPKNSTCMVSTPVLFGDKVIEVTYSQEQTFCTNNDTIQGVKDSSLGDIFKDVMNAVKDSLTFTDSLGNKVSILDSIKVNTK